MTFFSRYTEKFSSNYHNDRWNGSMLRRNEGLPWWHSQRIRLYVRGHVTNNWLNCCYVQAPYTKGHLTSISGGNRRPVQLILFVILSADQADCASGDEATEKPRTFSTSLCPQSVLDTWAVQRRREHLSTYMCCAGFFPLFDPLVIRNTIPYARTRISMNGKWNGNEMTWIKS